ncbi:hypothetical protein PGB90_008007 [Kerria lacca]
MYRWLCEDGKEPGRESVQRFLLQGQNLSKHIKRVALEGVSRISVAFKNKAGVSVDVEIEINNPNARPDVWTKQRFLAAMHIANVLNEYGIVSALAARVSWNNVKTVHETPLSNALGSGLHFMGVFFRDHYPIVEDRQTLVAMYWVCSSVLDYISITDAYAKKEASLEKAQCEKMFLLSWLQMTDYFHTQGYPEIDNQKDAACRNLGLKAGESPITAQIAALIGC